MKTRDGTVQRAQQAALREKTRRAQLQRDRRAVAAAQAKISVLTSERKQGRSAADRSRAARRVRPSSILSYTRDQCACRRHGRRPVASGRPVVQAGTQLMAVVPLHAVYVVANFKETQLRTCATASRSSSRSMRFHGTVLKGHVDSLSPASGLEFALLPPDNATGNFTKIVQRVPVKIVLDDQQPERPLAPGHVGGADHQHQGGRSERASKTDRSARRTA